ncbi:hypothetical protein NPIL_97201 [Nephila pilipes]|uniref:Uncharacterized protein n=1 Tax=Nephila pilipes TaxID=299642 RepID=A0A8X6TJ17_NEPPI|nr:hypothetical protein NPIL_97201 [Nephila pilipes]
MKTRFIQKPTNSLGSLFGINNRGYATKQQEDRPVKCNGCGTSGFIRAKCPNCIAELCGYWIQSLIAGETLYTLLKDEGAKFRNEQCESHL